MEVGTAVAFAIQGAGKMRVWETSQQAKCRGGRRAFMGTAIRSLCLLFNCKHRLQGKGRERNGTETKNQKWAYRGKNPLAYELPKREVVIKSGRTLYRFTGSYDGQRALPNKVLRLMGQDNYKKDVDKKGGSR